MANIDNPSGLRSLTHMSGQVTRVRYQRIASGYNTKLTIGDPVKLVAAGTIERAGVGDVIYGVFNGCQYTDANGFKSSKFWTAGTVSADAVAEIIDDPNEVFVVQCDGDFQLANIGNCADIVVVDGDDVYGSKVELDSSDLAAGTGQLKVIGLHPIEGNDYGDNALVEVVINEHFLKQTAGI